MNYSIHSNQGLFDRLLTSYRRCSDCSIHPEHQACLDELQSIPLTQEYIDFLCEKTMCKRHTWELRIHFLKILLLNNSAYEYDLKQYFYDCIQKTRQLSFKLYLIRGYAIYATEQELRPVIEKYIALMKNNFDYINYNHILSAAGLPYLVKTYPYPYLKDALAAAQQQLTYVNPYLQGFFTIDEDFNQINLLTPEEANRRTKMFMEYLDSQRQQ